MLLRPYLKLFRYNNALLLHQYLHLAFTDGSNPLIIAIMSQGFAHFLTTGPIDIGPQPRATFKFTVGWFRRRVQLSAR